MPASTQQLLGRKRECQKSRPYGGRGEVVEMLQRVIYGSLLVNTESYPSAQRAGSSVGAIRKKPTRRNDDQRTRTKSAWKWPIGKRGREGRHVLRQNRNRPRPRIQVCRTHRDAIQGLGKEENAAIRRKRGKSMYKRRRSREEHIGKEWEERGELQRWTQEAKDRKSKDKEGKNHPKEGEGKRRKTAKRIKRRTGNRENAPWGKGREEKTTRRETTRWILTTRRKRQKRDNGREEERAMGKETTKDARKRTIDAEGARKANGEMMGTEKEDICGGGEEETNRPRKAECGICQCREDRMKAECGRAGGKSPHKMTWGRQTYNQKKEKGRNQKKLSDADGQKGEIATMHTQKQPSQSIQSDAGDETGTGAKNHGGNIESGTT